MFTKRLKDITFLCGLIVIVSISFGCSYMPPVVQNNQLGADSVRTVFSGRTVLSQETSTGMVSASYYSSSGNVQQYKDGKLQTGKWSVNEKGEKCMKINAEEESCQVVVRDENNFYNAYNSSYFSVLPAEVYHSFVTGNGLKADRGSTTKEIKKKYDNMSVQKVLTNKGYKPGPVDGVWGARSRQALLKFQGENGLEKTGQPNAEVLEEIAKR